MPSLRFLVRTAPPPPVLEVPVPPLTQHLSQQVNLGHILLKSLRSPQLLVSVGLPGTQSWFWAGQNALHGTGNRGFPGLCVMSPEVGGLGNPVPLKAWGF